MRVALSDLPPEMRKQAEAKLGAKPTAPKPKANKTEMAFWRRLEGWYGRDRVYFNSVKLQLAERCWYTPDFFVALPSSPTFYEVKGGFIREDAVIKFKVAQKQYPMFSFEMWQLVKGIWSQIR